MQRSQYGLDAYGVYLSAENWSKGQSEATQRPLRLASLGQQHELIGCATVGRTRRQRHGCWTREWRSRLRVRNSGESC